MLALDLDFGISDNWNRPSCWLCQGDEARDGVAPRFMDDCIVDFEQEHC